MKTMRNYILIALAFWGLAGLLRYWIVPVLEYLPAGYSNAITLSEQDNFRVSPKGEWVASTLITERVDQVISNSGQVAIIEGGLHVYNPDGAVNFEATSLYGVDRRTRLNLAGYGSVNRTGQYLLPAHVKPHKYPIWDPFFVGLRQAAFDHVENIDGLQVYVFKFSGAGMDESAGYSYLADVPEHYLAHTDGQGTLWVEPLSGIIVDYMDSGISYFFDPTTGTRLADFNKWNERYTPETRTTQIKLASTARLRILLLEVWLPGVLLLVGVLFVGSSIFLGKKNAL